MPAAKPSVGSWTPVYLERTTRLDAVQAAAITSAFWAALCGGRIAAAVAGLRLSADRLLTVSYAAAADRRRARARGTRHVWPTVIGLTVLGFAFGPLYPTMMAVVTAASPQAAGAAASRIGVLASIGGMILPSLHGFLIARVGTWTSAAVTAVIVMIDVPRMDGDQAPLRRARLTTRIHAQRQTRTAKNRVSSTTAPRSLASKVWVWLESRCRGACSMPKPLGLPKLLLGRPSRDGWAGRVAPAAG